MYVGWGKKYEQFNPPQSPLPEIEFPQNFIEKNDPTVELEEARRVATSELTSEEEEDYDEQFTDEED